MDKDLLEVFFSVARERMRIRQLTAKMNPLVPRLLSSAQSASIINELSELLRARERMAGTPGGSALKWGVNSEPLSS